jgi:multidrug efflux system outer membrane protein
LPTLNAGLTASRAPGSGGNNSAYSAGLSVAAYEIDLFGRVRSLTDSAAAQVLASEERARSCRSPWSPRWPTNTWRWQPTTNCST